MNSRQHFRRVCAGSIALGTLLCAAPSAQFQSSNVTELDHLTLTELGSSTAEDCWGYVSASGREYALVGLSSGTGIVDVTDPTAAVLITTTNQGGQSQDIKVYQDYMYATSDFGSTFIFDLSNIDSGLAPQVGQFPAGAHNLFVNEDSGFLYFAIAGPMNIYDLSNPAVPSLVAVWPGETHDVQVVSYTSGQYAGREIAFVCAGFSRRFDIVDVTDKSNLVQLASMSYQNSGYTHQGWASEDLNYFYFDDELDGLPRTTIVDISDLSNPTVVGNFSHGGSATDHNLYWKDGYIYAANYTSGLRIVDANNPTNLAEVGFFDTFPANNSAGFNGAWTAYPFFPSGNVIISDISNGLFVVDPCLAINPATSISRNSGSNPSSLSSNAPVLGGQFLVTVDLGGTTGHNLAGIFGYASSSNLPLAGGQVLLVDVTDPSGELLAQPLLPGPSAGFALTVPNDMSLCGFSLSTQAVHIGGVQPFALSNALDLVIGR